MPRRSDDLHPRTRQLRVAASDCDGVGEWRETEQADLFIKMDTTFRSCLCGYGKEGAR